jgi:hypothetical protein
MVTGFAVIASAAKERRAMNFKSMHGVGRRYEPLFALQAGAEILKGVALKY